MGAGIVGNSVACHLARLGWRDLVLVDKGPMPNPGGSTRALTLAEDLGSDAITATDKRRSALIAQTANGRAGTAEDIAATVLFLASPGASHITEQTIHVNGGALSRV